jgi:hypothetical protein
MTRGRWKRGVASRRSFETHKAAIGSACQAFIDQVLKPRFLPEVRPTEFNYPIDINGWWHGSNYRFMQRYRSGFVHNAGWEFDAPFTRLEYVAGDLFHLSYLRHTGQWHRLYCEVSLSQALSLIESDGLLHPH